MTLRSLNKSMFITTWYAVKDTRLLNQISFDVDKNTAKLAQHGVSDKFNISRHYCILFLAILVTPCFDLGVNALQ